MKYKLNLREQIAKDLIERIRERVTDLNPSTETGVANTVVPNFDINYFNFYENFVKHSDSDQAEDDSPIEGHTKEKEAHPGNEISKSVKDMIVKLAEPFTSIPAAFSEGNIRVVQGMEQQVKATLPLPELDMMKEEAGDSPSLKHMSPTHDMLEEKDREEFMDKPVDQLKSPQDSPDAFEHRSEIEIKEKRPDAQEVLKKPAESYRDLKKEAELRGPLDFSSLKEIRKRHLGVRATISDPEHAMREAMKMTSKPKIQLPKMLVRLQSTEDMGQDEMEKMSIERRSKHSCTTFIRPPQSVKSGLHFTTNNIGVMFRLNKIMGKYDKFQGVEIIDLHIGKLKKVFGLHHVKKSVLEIKNQSLSNLCRYFLTQLTTSI